MRVDEQENPVASGLVALVAVAVVVGVLAGVAALALTKMLGVDGGSGGSSDPAAAESLYLPDPVPTTAGSGPLITLAPTETETAATDAPSGSPSPTPTPEAKPAAGIALSPGSPSVAAGEELLLTGTYPTGEGAVLDIFYNVANSGWKEFPLDVNVSGGLFQTKVATYKSGTIQWRVQDPETGKQSNPVSVRHGG